VDIPYSVNLLQRSDLAAVIRDLELCCLDIGARGGFLPDLQPLAFAVDAVGFEPHAQECRRLNRRPARPWKSLRYIPVGLSGSGGPRTLHVTAHPGTSTLLPPQAAVGRQYRRESHFTVIETRQVPTLTLNQALKEHDLPTPDFVKIDIEGAEYEVLAAAETVLASLAGIRTEVAFKERQVGQRRFSDIDRLLWAGGFEPVRLIEPICWRRVGRGIDPPHLAPGPVPYSRAELIHADVLYLKRPGESRAATAADIRQLLKCALVACCYGLLDYAAAIFMRPDVSEFLHTTYQLSARRTVRRTSRLFYRDHIRRQTAGFPRQAARLAKHLILLGRDAATWSSARHR
jgi:FkbM family methyltransferase